MTEKSPNGAARLRRRVLVRLCAAAACAAALALWAACALRPRAPDSLHALVPPPLRRYLRFPGDYSAPHAAPLAPVAATALRERLARRTYEECEVLHWRRYGPVARDAPVLVVRVHRDAARLQALLVSLAEVRDIHTAVLVLSHSYYDPALDQLARAVAFCKVTQIFYPHSVQANPDRFPGVDPSDCEPGELDADQAAFCVDRDARRAEHKHHWWWTAHHVFEGVEWAGAHRGPVLFLDEAVYVAPDLLHMVRLAQRALAQYPRAALLALGGAPGPLATRDYELLTVEPWRPPLDVALAFNRSAWRRIAADALHYCTFDDCSWSYSLQYLFSRRAAGPALAVVVAAPRVLDTRSFASGGAALREVRARFQRAAAAGALFPSRARLVTRQGRGRVRAPRGTGGWADLRDQLFCLDPLMSTGPPRDEDVTTVPPTFIDIVLQ